jgi:DNA replication protein DnaC
MASSPVAQSETECPICQGTGWKTIQTPGKSTRVTRCDCFFSRRIEKLLRQARIPARYHHCALETYSTTADRSQFLALGKATDLVKNYPNEKLGLLFTGGYGTGKTHLAIGIAKGLILKGIPCIFYDYRELLKEIQNSYNPNVDVTELQILRPVFETEVLILDELGAAKPTEWVWDAVQFILNTRYNAQLTTVITSNYPFGTETEQQPNESEDQFKLRKAGLKHQYTLGDRIGNRMISRLEEMCRLVPVNGPDFRKIHKNASTMSGVEGPLEG